MPDQSGATHEAQDKLDVGLATIPDAVAQSVRRFLAAVQQQRRVEAAYLYGSQVKGASTQWSDIDVAVISPDFADLFQERLALMRLAAQIDDRIEPYPFKPQDFNSSDPLAGEIRLAGVRVAWQCGRTGGCRRVDPKGFRASDP